MPFETGTKLGSYEILSLLGRGGMGAVYRARDSKLKREVAIKVLPDEFSRDSERIARFQREAEVLASLNHPRIASIYHLEEAGGSQFLVLELVEGETLAERVARGPIPVDEALVLAKELAEALEAAHEKGIIHRDLKPANIKLTSESQVKILDFGLAKAFAATPADTSMSNSPTLSIAATRAGVILGTAAYMSPEQARGRNTDRRTDIWAFGCVLYEMLSGKTAFHGEDTTEILAAVVKSEPDWTALPRDISPILRKLLHRCLEKDIRKRTRDAGDIGIECEEALSASTESAAASETIVQGPSLRWIFVGLAGLLLGGLIAGGAVWQLRPHRAAPVGRFALMLPPGQRLGGLEQTAIAFSPDGSRLVYVARAGGAQQLYVREIDNLQTRPLAGTEGAINPFFSPDGQWVAFFTVNKLKKVSINGGPPVSVASADNFGRGGAWRSDGTIVFAPGFASGLSIVNSAGGNVQNITTLKNGEGSHRFPHLLGDTGYILFTVGTGGSWDDARIEVLKPGTNERKLLIEGGSDARYLPTGHLIYQRAGNLMAVPFDVKQLSVTGSPVSLVDGLLPSTDNTGAAQAAFADLGSLIYVSGKGRVPQRTLAWMDRKGNDQPLDLPSRTYRHPRVSPDGRRLLVDIDEGNKADIWIYDFVRGNLARETFDGNAAFGMWTPDGKKVTFQSQRSGHLNIYWKTIDTTGTEDRLTTSQHEQNPDSWSPDGSVLAFDELDPVTGMDIWIVSLKGDRTPKPFVKTPFNEANLSFSLDGRWVAYQSDESGRDEIYVQPFSGPGNKELVSVEGGTEPLWSRDGHELVYRNGDKMMSVAVTLQPAFRTSKPVVLFERPMWIYPYYPHYDVSPDGRRFMMIKENEEAAAATGMTIILNWLEEVKQKVLAQR